MAKDRDEKLGEIKTLVAEVHRLRHAITQMEKQRITMETAKESSEELRRKRDGIIFKLKDLLQENQAVAERLRDELRRFSFNFI